MQYSVERSASSASARSARFAPSVTGGNAGSSNGGSSSSAGKAAAAAAKKKKKLDDKPKTLITLMGGRGYINWRRRTAHAHAHAQPNNCDAFVVIWEMKL